MKTFDYKQKNQKEESRKAAKRGDLEKKNRVTKAAKKQVKNMLSSAIRSRDYESLKDLDF